MNIYGSFPAVRMRRMRRNDFSRRLMREHVLTPNDLIYPVFVLEGKNRTEKVASMPGVERMPLERLLPVAEQCLKHRIPALAVFPVIEPRLKTLDGREAFNPKGLVPRTVAALKKRFPELGTMPDVALDPYTSHGQDGVVDRTGYIINDVTLDMLEKQALAQAEAGVDIVAPSDMMDGRVAAIRKTLDASGFLNVPILAYAARYASGFYGPFRTLTVGSLALYSRFMKAGLIEVIREDYVRTARAKGLSEFVVVVRHVARNSLIPIITLLGASLPVIIGGSIVVEFIFEIDGMGKLAYEAVLKKDYAVIMGLNILVAVLTTVGVFLADLAYAVVDPRIRLR